MYGGVYERPLVSHLWRLACRQVETILTFAGHRCELYAKVCTSMVFRLPFGMPSVPFGKY